MVEVKDPAAAGGSGEASSSTAGDQTDATNSHLYNLVLHKDTDLNNEDENSHSSSNMDEDNQSLNNPDQDKYEEESSSNEDDIDDDEIEDFNGKKQLSPNHRDDVEEEDYEEKIGELSDEEEGELANSKSSSEDEDMLTETSDSKSSTPDEHDNAEQKDANMEHSLTKQKEAEENSGNVNKDEDEIENKMEEDVEKVSAKCSRETENKDGPDGSNDIFDDPKPGPSGVKRSSRFKIGKIRNIARALEEEEEGIVITDDDDIEVLSEVTNVEIVKESLKKKSNAKSCDKKSNNSTVNMFEIHGSDSDSDAEIGIVSLENTLKKSSIDESVAESATAAAAGPSTSSTDDHNYSALSNKEGDQEAQGMKAEPLKLKLKKLDDLRWDNINYLKSPPVQSPHLITRKEREERLHVKRYQTQISRAEASSSNIRPENEVERTIHPPLQRTRPSRGKWMFEWETREDDNDEHEWNEGDKEDAATVPSPAPAPAATVAANPPSQPASPPYDPASPVYAPTSPVYESLSPVYDPTSPVYDPTSPVYDPTSPVYEPLSPVFKPLSAVWNYKPPTYQPSSPQYVMMSPKYRPSSPKYANDNPQNNENMNDDNGPEDEQFNNCDFRDSDPSSQHQSSTNKEGTDEARLENLDSSPTVLSTATENVRNTGTVKKLTRDAVQNALSTPDVQAQNSGTVQKLTQDAVQEALSTPRASERDQNMHTEGEQTDDATQPVPQAAPQESESGVAASGSRKESEPVLVGEPEKNPGQMDVDEPQPGCSHWIDKPAQPPATQPHLGESTPPQGTGAPTPPQGTGAPTPPQGTGAPTPPRSSSSTPSHQQQSSIIPSSQGATSQSSAPNWEEKYNDLFATHIQLLNSLQSLMECPICFEVPKNAPVPCCNNGHLICANCLGNAEIRECPACKVPMSRQNHCVSTLANSILDLIPHPCKFKVHGCQHEELSVSIKNHEMNCRFREIRCPYFVASDPCEERLSMANLPQHFDLHNHNIYDVPRTFYKIYSNEDGISSAPFRFRYDGQMFYLHVMNPPESHIVHNFVQMEGSIAECSKYRAHIQLIGEKNQPGFSQSVHITPLDLHCHEDLNRIGFVMIFTKMSLEEYISEDDSSFKLHVKMSKLEKQESDKVLLKMEKSQEDYSSRKASTEKRGVKRSHNGETRQEPAENQEPRISAQQAPRPADPLRPGIILPPPAHNNIHIAWRSQANAQPQANVAAAPALPSSSALNTTFINNPGATLHNFFNPLSRVNRVVESVASSGRPVPTFTSTGNAGRPMLYTSSAQTGNENRTERSGNQPPQPSIFATNRSGPTIRGNLHVASSSTTQSLISRASSVASSLPSVSTVQVRPSVSSVTTMSAGASASSLASAASGSSIYSVIGSLRPVLKREILESPESSDALSSDKLNRKYEDLIVNHVLSSNFSNQDQQLDDIRKKVLLLFCTVENVKDLSHLTRIFEHEQTYWFRTYQTRDAYFESCKSSPYHGCRHWTKFLQLLNKYQEKLKLRQPNSTSSASRFATTTTTTASRFAATTTTTASRLAATTTTTASRFATATTPTITANNSGSTPGTSNRHTGSGSSKQRKVAFESSPERERATNRVDDWLESRWNMDRYRNRRRDKYGGHSRSRYDNDYNW